MGGRNSLKLLKETFQTVETIGEDEVINVLKEARETHLNKENPILACIFAVIYKEFKITKKILKYGKDRKNGTRTCALHVCALLISEYIKQYKQVDIAFILNKDEADISRYMKRIYSLDSKILVDRELMQKITNARRELEIKLKLIEKK